MAEISLVETMTPAVSPEILAACIGAVTVRFTNNIYCEHDDEAVAKGAKKLYLAVLKEFNGSALDS